MTITSPRFNAAIVWASCAGRLALDVEERLVVGDLLRATRLNRRDVLGEVAHRLGLQRRFFRRLRLRTKTPISISPIAAPERNTSVFAPTKLITDSIMTLPTLAMAGATASFSTSTAVTIRLPPIDVIAVSALKRASLSNRSRGDVAGLIAPGPAVVPEEVDEDRRLDAMAVATR